MTKRECRKKTTTRKLGGGGGGGVIMPSVYLNSLYKFDILNNISSDLSIEYPVEKVLGEGTYGRVFISNNKVIKFSKFDSNNNNIGSSIKEDVFLAILDHPNILKLNTILITTNYFPHIIIPKMDGDLHTLVINSGLFNRFQVSTFLKQMLEALSYLHTNGILHSDIKPQNILYTFNSTNKKMTFYLADFGISQFYGIPAPKREYSTTHWYGPSIAFNKRNTRFDNLNTVNLDVYAIGVICIFLITGLEGNQQSNPFEYFSSKNDPNEYRKDRILNIIGEDGWDLLAQMWGFNLNNNIISAKDALKNSFLINIKGGEELHIYTEKNYLNKERELNYIDDITFGLKNVSCFFTVGENVELKISQNPERLDNYEATFLHLITQYANFGPNLTSQTNTNLLAIQILRRVIDFKKYITTVDIHTCFFIATCIFEQDAFAISFDYKTNTIVDDTIRKSIFDILNIINWRPVLFIYGVYIEQLILENYKTNPNLMTDEFIKKIRLICETLMTCFYLDNNVHEYLYKNQVTLNEFSYIIYYIAETIYFKDDKEKMKLITKQLDSMKKEIVDFLTNTTFVESFKTINNIDYNIYNVPCKLINFLLDQYLSN